MNMGFMHSSSHNSSTNIVTSQMPLNTLNNVSKVQKPQTAQNQKVPLQQKSIKRPMHNHKRSDIPAAQNSTLFSGYNLDDPEELEKWKAERRKRFPGVVKKEDDESAVESTEVGKKDEQEEGALLEETLPECEIKEDVMTVTQKSKRICKYFSRGKCNKGDSCQFEHIKKVKRESVFKKIGGRSTIFENLLKIEEKESMIKFYECIKLILRQ